jgi:hypothetical protein
VGVTACSGGAASLPTTAHAVPLTGSCSAWARRRSHEEETSQHRVGGVLLSPFIKPGTVSTVDYNHYSMLRTIEDIFGLSHLGDAAMPQVKSFGTDVFTRS